MNLSSRIPSLTTILWILASLVAFGAFLFIAPNLLNPPQPTATPTGISLLVPSPQATSTIPPTDTPIPVAPPSRNKTEIPLPTAEAGAKVYTFIADPTRSGYIKDGEDKPHWGDRNLHAGIFGDDAYSSILFFDIAELAPDSEILDAEVIVTGLSRDNLGAQGQWRAQLVHLPFVEWQNLTTQEVESAVSITSIGSELSPPDLNLGNANQFRFTSDQMPALLTEIGGHAFVIVRLQGPTTGDNSLFTWDSGGLELKTGAHPLLRIVARPGQFVIVTNTPTAESVVTAAAIALRETAFAKEFGTPTPFPRTHATATPIIFVTREPTPENVDTRVAIAQFATAVAITTGTYTPTPLNWVEITATFTAVPTRTPQVVPVSTLYARLTPTLRPTKTPSTAELLQTPVPDFLKGNLLVITDRFLGSDIAVMRPSDGTITEGLTSNEFYDLAFIRESFSPDRKLRAIVAPDSSDVLQIWMEDTFTADRAQLTHLARGIAYDPVWSPDGGSIAYVSRESGTDELYIYNLGSEISTQITTGGNPFIYKQKPTWSPDGLQIAFKANDGTLNFQIWLVNADGSNPRNISQSTSNDFDPVWVK